MKATQTAEARTHGTIFQRWLLGLMGIIAGIVCLFVMMREVPALNSKQYVIEEPVNSPVRNIIIPSAVVKMISL